MSAALYGPLAVASLLLVVAGAAKIQHPASTAAALDDLGVPGGTTAGRLLGIGEVVLGVATIATGAAALAALVAVAYAAFAGVVLVTRRSARLADCGCFGAAVTPPSLVHATANVLLAVGAAAAAAVGVPSLAGAVGEQAWGGVPYLALVGVTTYLVRVAITDLAGITTLRGVHS